MNTPLFTMLQASAQQGGFASYSGIIMIVALFAIMYFFMIRPQNKKQKREREFRNSLREGDEVMTIGGLHGKVHRVNDQEGTVVLEVATGVRLVFEKTAIMPGANAVEKK